MQTNLGPDDLTSIGLTPGNEVSVHLGATSYEVAYVRAYGEVEPGEAMVIIDSQGLVAICVRDGRADEEFNLGADQPVIFRQPPKS